VGNAFPHTLTKHKLSIRSQTQAIQSCTGLGGFLYVPFGCFLAGKTALPINISQLEIQYFTDKQCTTNRPWGNSGAVFL